MMVSWLATIVPTVAALMACVGSTQMVAFAVVSTSVSRPPTITSATCVAVVLTVSLEPTIATHRLAALSVTVSPEPSTTRLEAVTGSTTVTLLADRIVPAA